MADVFQRAAGQIESARQRLDPGDDEPVQRRQVREALLAARADLVAGGVSEALARVLTEETGTDGGTPRSAVATLLRAQRRMREFAAAVERPPSGVPDRAAQELRDVLDDPLFASAVPRATLRERAWHHLERLLQRLAPWLARAVEGSGPWLGTIVVTLIFLVVAASLWLLWVRRFLQPPRRGSMSSTAVSASPHPETRSNDALAIADSHLSAGRPLAALRWLQQAVVLALREQGHLPPDPGLTDLESARSVEAHAPPALVRDFVHIVDLHDRVVFAGQPIVSAALHEARRRASVLVGWAAAETG